MGKDDAYFVDGLYDSHAQHKPIEYPSHLDNFDQCELRSVMCCWPSDRQANDNNGNCATPYDERCVDADPADNTDLCAVDMARSTSTSIKVPDGLAFFEGNTEGPIHCHGFAWGFDDMEADSRYKGNNLFYVSMYDHMYQRGYVRNVPGAPMCGCVEKMPIVSRSDCTEIDAEETWRIQWTSGENIMAAELGYVDIDFNACRGAGGNNDLYKFYKRLRNEGRATNEEYNLFKKTVVGNHQCPNAIADLYFDKGYELDSSPPEGWTQVYGKGVFGAEDTYSELWELGSPYIKQAGTSTSPVFYIMRKCLDCSESHKEIIYKRLTPVPGNLNMETLFTWYWADSPGNVQGVDFNLFSSMEDALDDSDPWTYCNYNDYGIGFPRDCGPNGRVNHQWNSVWRNGRGSVAFYVWNDNINIGDSIPEPPTDSPTPLEDSISITTPNWYYYRPLVDFTEVSSDSGYVTFTVDSTHMALIAMGEDTNHNGPHYEIVLGDWSNRRCRLFGRNRNDLLDEYYADVLEPGVDQMFRISWSVSEITVEQQGGSNWFEIMKFSDRDNSAFNHDINYMMVATGWGASGVWNIVNYSGGASGMIFTPNHYSYMPIVQDFTDESAGYVTFSVKANNDAHIAIGEDTNHNGVHYEIVIGGWGNRHSKIRASNQGQTLADYPGVVLNSDEYILFRISWDDTMLKVERSPDYEESNLVEIMNYDRSEEGSYKYDINNFMIATGWGATGLWRIIDHSDVM